MSHEQSLKYDLELSLGLDFKPWSREKEPLTLEVVDALVTG
jgi:hypothetical protein